MHLRLLFCVTIKVNIRRVNIRRLLKQFALFVLFYFQNIELDDEYCAKIYAFLFLFVSFLTILNFLIFVFWSKTSKIHQRYIKAIWWDEIWLRNIHIDFVASDSPKVMREIKMTPF